MMEELLLFMGVKKLFENDGSLTKDGEKALSKAVRIVTYFEQMGLVMKNCTDLEDKCDEIIKLGY